MAEMHGDVGEVTSAAIVAAELAKEYGDTVALHDFSLIVQPGELVALVGHNGSGKSTFLRLVAGLAEPTGGALLVASARPGSDRARAEVSFIPDEPVLYDDLSVAEHVEYVGRLHGDDTWPERAGVLTGLLGLEARADDLPSRFSRGLRQRTGLLLGLVRPFSVLLVDEPFVGLDPRGRQVCADLVAAAAADGNAVVVATHQLELLARATRCVALRDGAIEYSGPPDVRRVEALLG
ncbi:MAG: ABC transporter ATP-binding protein [Acidimicrobiia bacterium]|nr:ABC transporter ATP-binding protein [Acidimicrobiia bacterium]